MTNKYLARLKSETEPPKVPKAPSVTFVTAPRVRAEKNASADALGEFWPWAPYLCAADVERFRTEVVALIEKLADMEDWPDEHRDDVLARAIRGPLADLLPNLHHFNQRLTEAAAAAAAREAVEKRSWRFDR